MKNCYFVFFSDARPIGRKVEFLLCAAGANSERQENAVACEAASPVLEILSHLDCVWNVIFV